MYLVLSTTTLAHDHNRDLCLQHDGILPEPRSQKENEFLNNLGSEMFLLGMSDKDTEGRWLWDSDRTPVDYFNWGAVPGAGQEPNGQRSQNCIVMMRNFVSGGASWADISCASDYHLEAQTKSLICQKNGGMCKLMKVLDFYPND